MVLAHGMMGMAHLPGLDVMSTVAVDGELVTLRAMRDNQIVLLTLPQADPPSTHALARLVNQLDVCHDVMASGIARALSLTRLGHRPALVLEDAPGKPLTDELGRGPMAIDRFLQVAMALTESVVALHARNIVHRNLSPHSVLVDPGGRATLIDLTHAIRLPRQRTVLAAEGRLDGRMHYTSPEQTGRMNRGIDHRTDCYSLGVTFYEMLTGRVPFSVTDPLELMHCHIARAPRPPEALNPAVPPSLSALVMKLLAKMPEDRYQTAHGLLADLKQAQTSWQNTGTVAPFVPGEREVPDWLRLSGRPYGRQAETAALTALWDGAREGRAGLAVVQGPSGLGKSLLVGEMREQVARDHGAFVSGKFDAVRASDPYAPLLDALAELVRQSLAAPDAQIAAWRESMRKVVGPGARILTDAIPDLLPIVGEWPPLPTLPDAETQNRFRTVLRDGVRVLAGPDRPLVLFMDDVQWADPAALQVLHDLCTAPAPHHLAVVCATRGRDGTPAALAAMDELRAGLTSAGVPVAHLELAPMTAAAAAEMLADAMRLSTAEATPLAELVVERTRGNPLLIRVMVETLYDEELLRFDRAQGRWTWDWGQIALSAAVSDVVDYVNAMLARLPPLALETVQVASCLGHAFQLKTLAAVSRIPLVDMAQALRKSIDAGVLQERDGGTGLDRLAGPRSGGTDARDTWLAEVEDSLVAADTALTLSFVHDRLQQSAYGLLSAEAARSIHARIGMLLLADLSAAELSERLLEVVDHLNRGGVGLASEADRLRLIELNARAGRKARATSAYATAAALFGEGLALVREADWSERYHETFALHLEMATCTASMDSFEAATPWFELCLRKGRTPVDMARTHSARIGPALARGLHDQAFADAQAGLQLLGIRYHKDVSMLRVAGLMLETRWRLRGKKPAQLVDLPLMTREDSHVAMEILMEICGVAYDLRQEVAGVTYLTMVTLTLAHGLTDLAASGFTIYGLLLASGLQDYAAAEEFGRLGVSVARRLQSERQLGRALFFKATLLHHWSNPVATNRDLLREAKELCDRNGDFAYSVYCDSQFALVDIVTGAPLARVLADARGYGQSARNWHMQAMVPYSDATVQWARALTGQTRGLDTWEDGTFVNADFDKHLLTLAYSPAEMFVMVRRLSTAVLADNWSAALALAEAARPRLQGMAGQLLASEFAFLHGLALADGLAHTSGPAARRMKRELKGHARQLKTWAARVPGNFASRHALVEAELARRLGQPAESRRWFAAAIAAAEAADEPNLLAMSCERAGRLYDALGDRTHARVYLGRAVVDYARWGATAKAEQVERALPGLLGSPLATQASGSGGWAADDSLDLATVLKAAQAVSSDLRLHSVLASVMRAAIENAGARTGFLLLERPNAADGALQWIVEAASSVDAAPTTQQGLTLADVPGISAQIVQYVARTGEVVLLTDARLDPRFSSDPRFHAGLPVSVLCVPLANQGRTTAIVYLENDLTTGAFTAARVRVLQLLSAQAAISIDNARLYEEVEGMARSFARFVPTEFLHNLRRTRVADIRLGESVQKVMSVLFSDIRGFTSLVEGMSADENIAFINNYLAYMEPAILQHGGFVDSYIGDAIMALFDGEAGEAVAAAVAMQRALTDFNTVRAAAGQPIIEMGVGVNTGELTLGTIGGKERIKCGVIGDAVNLASRVESLTKSYAVQVLISDATWALVQGRDSLDARRLDRVRVVGRVETVELYEIFTANAPDLRAAKLAALPAWDAALAKYQSGDFAGAETAFAALAAALPEDVPARLYVARCARYLREPPDADWDGVELLDHK